MKIPVKTIVTVILAGVAIALVVVPQLSKGPPGAGKPGFPPVAEATTYSVRTQTLATGSLRDYLDLTGDVVTETNVAVYPDVGGKLAAVYVQVGDQVVKGKTVIAAVDPSKPGASYALSSVYSPLTGTLTTLNAQLGATVSTGTSLGTVGVLSDLMVESKVPEVQVAQVKTGLKAEVQFEAFPGKTFQAVVDRVAPVVDPTSRTKTIRLTFEGDASRVDLGMFAKVKLLLQARTPEVLAPEEAVISRLGKKFVFVVEGAKAVRREVAVGLSVDGLLELVSDVKAGETLVVRGQELLDDGAAVKVVK
jgi:multidrug efflux pump subunit AcrA (membrane-fusion protein)